MPFDFSTATPVAEVDDKQVVKAQPNFDFSSAKPIEEKPADKIGAFAKAARTFSNTLPITWIAKSVDLAKNIDKIGIQPRQAQETEPQFRERFTKGAIDYLHQKDIEKEKAGVLASLEEPMQAAIVVGLAVAPVATAVGVAGFNPLDHFINLRRYVDKHYPNASANVLDAIEILDFAIKGGILGGAFKAGEGMLKGKPLDAKFIKQANEGKIDDPKLIKSVNDIILKGGGELLKKASITKGLPEFKEPAMVYWNDPKSGTTFGMPIDKLSPDMVRQKIAAKQKLFAEKQPSQVLGDLQLPTTITVKPEELKAVMGEQPKALEFTPTPPEVKGKTSSEIEDMRGDILKAWNSKEIELMKAAGLPDKNINEYVSSSLADGAKLSAYTSKVLSGEMTHEAAVAKIKTDYEKLVGKPTVEQTGLLSPDERADFLKTLGTDENTVNNALMTDGLNVSIDKLQELRGKQYWNKLEGALKPPTITPPPVKPTVDGGAPEPQEPKFKPVVSKADSLYQDYINRFASIEKIGEKAKKAAATILPGENPGLRAREYLGFGGKARSFLDDKTFRITPEGKIEITGEGLKPILDDFAKEIKPIEKNITEQQKDFNEYFIAKRTIEDLQRPKYADQPEKGNIATTEQVKTTREILARLHNKYRDNIAKFDNIAPRIYEYQKRVLHLLVESGRMSEDLYQKIIGNNQNYIPFDRVLGVEEDAAGAPVAKRIFSKVTSPVKRIKGSELPIEDVVSSIIKNTYKILDSAERNTVARSVANLKDVLPTEMREVKAPIVPLARASFKAEIDPKLTDELLKVISDLKGRYARKMSDRHLGGSRMGYYAEPNEIVTKFGTKENVIAHELGHFIDKVYGLQDSITKISEEQTGGNKAMAQRFRATINKELRILADLRKVSPSYARKGTEKMAALMDAYITKPQLLDEVAPTAKAMLENIIASHEELAPLKKIRPSMEIQFEETMQTIFGPSKFGPKGNVIEYYVDGKPKYVEVSRELYEAMTGLNETSSGVLIKILAAPAHLLRTGATITPEFITRNVFRDQLTALMQTNFGFAPFIDSAQAVGDIMGKTDVYYDWLRSGGSYSGFVELSRSSMKKAAKELTHPASSELLKRLNIITDLQDLSQLFEQATRVGVYKAAIRKGKTPVEAGFESRQATVDFARRGAKTKEINAVIAFFNAGVQGLDNTVRQFKKNPIGTTAKGIAAYTIPSLMLYMLNRKDPEYQEIPRWQKDLFYLIKVGDVYARIPKDFVYGQIFSSIPERFFEYLDKRDPAAFENLHKSIMDAVSPVNGDPAGGMLATGLKPLVENATNWSFFRQRPLVPEGKQKLLPEQQYNEYTSEVAKAIGRATKYSPIKIDNLFQGYLGTSGRYVTQAGDWLIEQIKGEAKERAPLEAADLPLLKGWVTRPYYEMAASVDSFYNNYSKVASVHSSYNAIMKESGRKAAQEFADKYPEAHVYQAFNAAYKNIKGYTEKINKTVKDKNLSDDEKRAKLKPLYEQRIKAAVKANELMKKENMDRYQKINNLMDGEE